MSNKLIDILDDETKVDKLNEDYHYRQSVLPRLKKLVKFIMGANESEGILPTNGETNYGIQDYEFVDDLISDLKETPHHRLTPLEMKECNKLWKKYK